MIRFDYSPDQIRAAVDALDATWIKRAEIRTKAFKQQKKYEETSNIWGDIKPIFIQIQKRKCAFCDRQFEAPEYGKIEYDLEHFRPKSSVKIWPPADLNLSYDFPLGKESKSGYYWLAYDLENYAVGCGVCNTVCKSNYFPILGNRKSKPASVTALASEKPLLCFPIGKHDDDPEGLVTFSATTAVPAQSSGVKHQRGKLIIDFFKLNLREQLHRERAFFITMMNYALAGALQGNAGDQSYSEQLVSGAMPHTACVRAFKRVWDTDRPGASRIADACKAYLAATASVPAPAA